MSTIQGMQLIYRLRTTIRLFIDYRVGVDSFNIYHSSTSGGVYALLGNVLNVASLLPATRGKVIFEFHTSSLAGWSDDTRNYIKLTQIIGIVESPKEGPLEVPTRVESIIPKEFSVMYGLNAATQKFIPIAVDPTGQVMTVP
jgi:hypothetical protein